MNEKCVGDIMVPLEEYACIPDTLTLGGAIAEMSVQILRKGQATLPRVALVFDESFGELLGMLRRRDIMRGLEPRFMLSGSLEYRRKLFNVEIDPNLAELSHDKIVAGIRKRASCLVRAHKADLPTVWAVKSGHASQADRSTMLTMAPSPWANIEGATALAQ